MFEIAWERTQLQDCDIAAGKVRGARARILLTWPRA